ncbi:C-C motif chemokine 18-like [Gymnodraco acuticeps]|uniref:C-C motif chemokine 18-like n=1 Tax=Gymnodraco acuticeps TaxID=8218 RepID=A0A6P8UBH6_GYMAC|nr:C-C motif chemokine 18-like [Gymnodraco acuticeps]
MKTLVTLVLLICVLRHCTAALFGPSTPKDGCCNGFTTKQIPRRMVKHVAETPSDCESRAIVITTVCLKKFCIDPNLPFTKKQFALFKTSANGFNVGTCPMKQYKRVRG